jgi:DNA-directed RNA polymerase specialized sigma24 family protein
MRFSTGEPTPGSVSDVTEAVLPSNEMLGERPARPESLDRADVATSQRRIAMLLEHRRRILSRIRALMRNEDDALDLLQDVSIAVLMSPIDFEDKGHFMRWCSGVVQRTALQSYRHSLRRARLEAEVGGACRGSGFDPVADPEARAARRQLVDRGIAAVDMKSRNSPAAIRVKLSRIRAIMRRALR